MKKLLGVGLVGAAVVGIVVIAKSAGAIPAATPEGRTCIKLADLCAVDDKSTKKLETCVDDLEKAKKAVGEQNVKRSMDCVAEANSCMAATGCMMGGVGVGALGEMMKGFGSAISR